MEAYVNKNAGKTVLLKVNIKDWESPVAQQFHLDGIPAFLVYDGQGKRIADGDAAQEWVADKLSQ